MNPKCFFGMHSYQKMGGPTNVGNGKFRQRMICMVCRKVKEVIE